MSQKASWAPQNALAGRVFETPNVDSVRGSIFNSRNQH